MNKEIKKQKKNNHKRASNLTAKEISYIEKKFTKPLIDLQGSLRDMKVFYCEK